MTAREPLQASLAPSVRGWEKFWNTYVRMPLPWMLRPPTHKHWEKQGLGDGHGPDKFLELTPSSRTLLAEIERVAPERQMPLLDLGCNVGRHLDALWQAGYRNLYGVDIQSAALAYMAEMFPAMRAGSRIELATFQDYLPTVEDQRFDVVFTHGATIELVPPTYPICQEMARVSRRAVALAISESGHLYPRLWEREFLRAGFLMTRLMRPIPSAAPLSLMTFERI